LECLSVGAGGRSQTAWGSSPTVREGSALADCCLLSAVCCLRFPLLYLRDALHHISPTSIPSAIKAPKSARHRGCQLVREGETSTNMKNFGKGISGALLSLAFVFGIVAATSDTSQAQYRNNDDYYQRGQSKHDRKDQKREWKRRRKQERRANRQGNNQGDWRRDQDRNRNNGVYGNNDQYGRNRGYGNNGGYGNNDQYGRNRGYGNNGGYDQVELDRGYQQGLQTGASDGQRNQSYDPQRSRHFKNASTQAFREGFVRGYDQGYRQYAGNRNGQRNGNTGWGNILGGILGGQQP
jgi:hypothetical protein